MLKELPKAFYIYYGKDMGLAHKIEDRLHEEYKVEYENEGEYEVQVGDIGTWNMIFRTECDRYLDLGNNESLVINDTDIVEITPEDIGIHIVAPWYESY